MDLLNLTTVTRPCQCDQPPGDTETAYFKFNIIVVMILLPTVAMVGIITNICSVIIYSRPELRSISFNRYLATLALADICVNICGIAIIAGDTARGFSPLIQKAWVHGLPYVFPFLFITQMTNIYLTVGAAWDCFLSVCAQYWFRVNYCSPKTADRVIIITVIGVLVYNLVVFWELETVDCYDMDLNTTKKEICPTALRMRDTYISVYKVTLYSVFMVFLPVAILGILNSCIIYRVIVFKRAEKIADESAKAKGEFVERTQASDGTMMLVMVIMLFLGCNSISLIINFLEVALDPEIFSKFKHFLIDASNLLVIFNSSANCFIYLLFSPTYRIMFYKYILRQKLNTKMAHTLAQCIASQIEIEERAEEEENWAVPNKTTVINGNMINECVYKLKRRSFKEQQSCSDIREKSASFKQFKKDQMRDIKNQGTTARIDCSGRSLEVPTLPWNRFNFESIDELSSFLSPSGSMESLDPEQGAFRMKPSVPPAPVMHPSRSILRSHTTTDRGLITKRNFARKKMISLKKCEESKNMAKRRSY